MEKLLNGLLALVLLSMFSLSEPLTVSPSKAGWGQDEMSCTGADWYWQGGQCVPNDLGADIVVYGSRDFDTTFFSLYILPLYSMAPADYTFLPVAAEPRETELNRRRRLHDCEVRNLAAGMRADIPGLSTQLEVTFEYQGVRARFDIVESVGGIPTGVTEVKTVLDFEGMSDDLLVRNQPIVAEGIRNGGAIPVGANAAAAGFIVGAPIGRNLPFLTAALPITGICSNS